MKKTILILSIFASISAAQAQNKPIQQDTVQRDTLVQITMKLAEYNAFEQALNANIDSKTATKQLTDYLRQRLRLVQEHPQPADKPKK